MADAPETYDIAIIGGGISGLYTAWRLASQTDGPPLRVCLHEWSDRLGGRMDTRQVPTRSTRVELGAMRFPPSQQMISSLLNELQVATEPFPAQDFLHMYLRGKPLSFSPSPAGPPTVNDLPYRLAGTESSHPFVLLTQALLRILPPPMMLGQTGFEKPGANGKGTPISAAEWDQILGQVTVDGKPLWQWGFWNLLNRVMSNEAYQYLLDAFGVESAVSNWNALLAMRLLCTIMGDAIANDLRHPVGGWIELVNALEAKLQALPNCTVVKNSMLLNAVQINPQDNASAFQLTFWVNKFTEMVIPTGPKTNFTVDLPSVAEVVASNLVLALPPRGIELLNLGFLNNDQLRAFIQLTQQVMRIPAFKAYVSYEEPWWRQWCGFDSGYTVTDLPLRQVFYGIGFSGPKQQSADDQLMNQRILMTSYADARTVDFWSGLLPPGQRVSEFWGAAQNQKLPIRQAMNREMKELHGYEFDFPDGEWACTVDWTADPFGAGWHAWRPNVDVLTEIPKMRRPLSDWLPELKLFLCGEAFSHIQGWIEGAITSAEMLLEEQFKLKRPSWIPADYPLGPAMPAPKSTSNTGA